jgi:hypothetical protein
MLGDGLIRHDAFLLNVKAHASEWRAVHDGFVTVRKFRRYLFTTPLVKKAVN